MSGIFNIVAIWLRIVCAIALVCVGFAHRMPAAYASPLTQERAAYALPDGTIPVLCTPQEDGSGGKKGSLADKGCDACRLSTSTDLPHPAILEIPLMKRVRQAVLPVRFEAFTRQLFPPNAAPRAPPTVSLFV